ncbi:unnamed protein product [Linum trigynum]|uniref:Dynein light chain n=2 Tax=Linum trigynum TaxID=586398 RepID=A0AAV2G7W9_9ROSI
MAHHTTTTNHRRILTSHPEPPSPSPPKPKSTQHQPSPSAMDPTSQTSKAHHPTTTIKIVNRDPPPAKPNASTSSSFMSNYLSSRLLNPSHYHHSSNKNPPPPCLDSHLQARAMTASADFEASSRLPAAKAKYYYAQQRRPSDGRGDKETLKRVVGKQEALPKGRVKKQDLDLGLVVMEEKKKVLVVSEKTKKKSSSKNDDVADYESGKKEMRKEMDLLLFEGVDDVKRMSSSVSFGVGGERRRSLSGSQVQLGDFLASNGAKIVSVDMPPFMQIHAIDCARKTCDSLEKFAAKTLALTLKKEFDGVYGPAWHCIVGTSFGSFVTHSVGGFLYFSMDSKLYVLLFKTTVQRAADSVE